MDQRAQELHLAAPLLATERSGYLHPGRSSSRLTTLLTSRPRALEVRQIANDPFVRQRASPVLVVLAPSKGERSGATASPLSRKPITTETSTDRERGASVISGP
jgi:hypothetical protein